MPNKFRSVRPLPIPEDTSDREGMYDLTKGLLLDRSARLLPLGASPNLDLVRFENGGLRKDFGSTAVGTAAASKILGIGEYKYIEGGQSFHRLIRLRRSGNKLQLDIWDGATWVATATSAEDIADVYLSLASVQNRFVIADGTVLLNWHEGTTSSDEKDDFVAGNSLTTVGEEVDAVVSPAGAIDDEYRVYHSVDISIFNADRYVIVLAIDHNGVEVTTVSYGTGPGVVNASWVDVFRDIVRSIANNDTLTLRVKSIVAQNKPEKSVNWAAGATHDLEATKTQDDVDQSVGKTYRYTMKLMTVDTDLQFFYDADDGAGWQLITTRTFSPGEDGSFEDVFNIGSLPSGAKFGMNVSVGDGVVGQQTPGVKWEGIEPAVDFDLVVKGYNQAGDGDPHAGVEYTISVPPASTLEPLSPDAPGARFILPFGDRLLAYRNEGDHQVAAWSADGNITEWLEEDSGETVLLDTRSDGIDDLMGAAVLTGSIVAVFRKRSIMRAQETGNVALAMGHYHWIEELGTESPFSIRATPAGIMFLGHDLQVYLLTSSGPNPLGQTIHKELIRTLTSNLELVDSAYDGIFGEYYLGVPENNASSITGVWIFELKTFLERQEVKWRRRTMAVERFGAASVIE